VLFGFVTILTMAISVGDCHRFGVAVLTCRHFDLCRFDHRPIYVCVVLQIKVHIIQSIQLVTLSTRHLYKYNVGLNVS